MSLHRIRAADPDAVVVVVLVEAFDEEDVVTSIETDEVVV